MHRVRVKHTLVLIIQRFTCITIDLVVDDRNRETNHREHRVVYVILVVAFENDEMILSLLEKLLVLHFFELDFALSHALLRC